MLQVKTFTSRQEQVKISKVKETVLKPVKPIILKTHIRSSLLREYLLCVSSNLCYHWFDNDAEIT